ncbi:MAG: hypothetical protein NTZ09_10325 [Candidatus Hydrogenedentes bacterium]|nr:hypothetical protein [Candidatus Hydrogenedentota bacterium]
MTGINAGGVLASADLFPLVLGVPGHEKARGFGLERGGVDQQAGIGVVALAGQGDDLAELDSGGVAVGVKDLPDSGDVLFAVAASAGQEKPVFPLCDDGAVYEDAEVRGGLFGSSGVAA